MNNRIFKNWNFRRAFYVLIGGFVIVESINTKTWFGLIPGIYFSAMGLFAFGCASGNCYGGNCEVPSQKSILKK